LIVALRSLLAKKWQARMWFPLAIGLGSIFVAYQLDIKQVLADEGMQDFWKELLMKHFDLQRFLVNTYAVFSNVGSGDLFGNIFGVLGVAAFLYSTYLTTSKRFLTSGAMQVLMQYSCLLLWVMIGLFAAGKLPLGTWRLNSFAVPAIGFMIVYLLMQWHRNKAWRITAISISVILFLALVGNVFTTMAELASPEHARKLRIYKTTDIAIKEARERHLPILTTSAIAYPFDDRWPGDWIVKTHPRYQVDKPLEVYNLPSLDSAQQYARHIAAPGQQVLILDGDRMKIVRR
jgi:hypothetical protein